MKTEVIQRVVPPVIPNLDVPMMALVETLTSESCLNYYMGVARGHNVIHRTMGNDQFDNYKLRSLINSRSPVGRIMLHTDPESEYKYSYTSYEGVIVSPRTIHDSAYELINQFKISVSPSVDRGIHPGDDSDDSEPVALFEASVMCIDLDGKVIWVTSESPSVSFAVARVVIKAKFGESVPLL